MGNASDSSEFRQTNTILKWIAGLVSAIIVVVVGFSLNSMHTSQQKTLDTLGNHESRLVKTETCLQYMANDISEIKEISKEIKEKVAFVPSIRLDQVRRENKEKKEGK